MNTKEYREGLHDGIPIGLGYFAVGFTIGIIAYKIGLTPLEGMITSFTNNASAGQYVGFKFMEANGSYIGIAIATLVTNARYLLMSCALSQKIAPTTAAIHRFIIGYAVTDEIFGIAISRKGYLNPFYYYGAMTVALPGWSLGTLLGVLCAGSAMPPRVLSALSVALYGMFIAVIIPPAKKNRVIAGLVALSFLASLGATYAPWISTLSSGTRTILLTVVLSTLAALLFPLKEEAGAKEKASSGEK